MPLNFLSVSIKCCFAWFGTISCKYVRRRFSFLHGHRIDFIRFWYDTKHRKRPLCIYFKVDVEFNRCKPFLVALIQHHWTSRSLNCSMNGYFWLQVHKCTTQKYVCNVNSDISGDWSRTNIVATLFDVCLHSYVVCCFPAWLCVWCSRCDFRAMPFFSLSPFGSFGYVYTYWYWLRGISARLHPQTTKSAMWMSFQSIEHRTAFQTHSMR